MSRQMMRSSFVKLFNNKLFRSAGTYTVTSVVNKAIPFLLLPILTRYLSPADYGIVSMFGVLISFTEPFVGLSIHGAIARVYYEKDSIDIREYIANALLILCCSTVFVAALFFFFADIIVTISSVPLQLLWMVIVISFAHFISRIVLTLWQVQVKPRNYGVYEISNTALNLLLSIGFIVVGGLTWMGRVYAQTITAGIYILLGLIILFRHGWLKLRVNKAYIKHALSFGVPLVPHALSSVILNMTDRLFITNMVGIETTGIYTVGYQVGMVINILAMAFNQAFVPWLYSKLKEDNAATKRKIVKLTYAYFFAIAFLAIGLSVFAPPLLSLFVGRSFAQSSRYVSWVAIGYAFNGMYLMVVNYFFYVSKNHFLAIVTFSTAIVNLVLNYVLIKNFGAIGAAQATAVVYLLKFISVWVISARVYKMPWKEVLRSKKYS